MIGEGEGDEGVVDKEPCDRKERTKHNVRTYSSY
jgi:hypothetical protein